MWLTWRGYLEVPQLFPDCKDNRGRAEIKFSFVTWKTNTHYLNDFFPIIYKHHRKMQRVFYLPIHHRILHGVAKLADRKPITIISVALCEWLSTLDIHGNHMGSFTMYWCLGQPPEDYDLIGLGCSLGIAVVRTSLQKTPLCSQNWNLLL